MAASDCLLYLDEPKAQDKGKKMSGENSTEDDTWVRDLVVARALFKVCELEQGCFEVSFSEGKWCIRQGSNSPDDESHVFYSQQRGSTLHEVLNAEEEPVRLFRPDFLPGA